MLVLRRGTVVKVNDNSKVTDRSNLTSTSVAMQELVVSVAGENRSAIADTSVVGLSQTGDEVVVNVAAVALKLGSGGFDVVHVNLTRGLQGEGEVGAHVMKLNYSSLQHAVHPVENSMPVSEEEHGDKSHHALSDSTNLLKDAPVGVCLIHGQLPPLAWAFHNARPKARLGYIQTAGGGLPGKLSKTVSQLRERGILAGHITAGPAYGGESEAISTAGAIAHALVTEKWDAVVCAPGPGILGSGTIFGHGSMVALDSAHIAASLGCSVVIAPRCSSGDPRERHRGLSHHTKTILSLALVPFTVAFAHSKKIDEGDGLHFKGEDQSQRIQLININGNGVSDDGVSGASNDHLWQEGLCDLGSYKNSGLPTTTMGRSLGQDPDFFAASLAAGSVLAEKVR